MGINRDASLSWEASRWYLFNVRECFMQAKKNGRPAFLQIARKDFSP
jgi:hypothetical protein